MNYKTRHKEKDTKNTTILNQNVKSSMFFINYKRGEITLIDEILTNNSEKVDKKLIQYTLQLRALNHLKNNNKIDEIVYKSTKAKINKNSHI